MKSHQVQISSQNVTYTLAVDVEPMRTLFSLKKEPDGTFTPVDILCYDVRGIVGFIAEGQAEEDGAIPYFKRKEGEWYDSYGKHVTRGQEALEDLYQKNRNYKPSRWNKPPRWQLKK